MKHKHADLIHQWADGAEIQRAEIRAKGTINDITEIVKDWIDEPFPTWNSPEYRVKPEEKKPVVRWLWVFADGTYTNKFATEEEAKQYWNPVTKLEWSRTEFPE